MTFIYELDPYSLEMHRICQYKLPTSRPSKVIVLQTDKQTDRQTRPKTRARRFAGGQKEKVAIAMHCDLKAARRRASSCEL